jgi:hypothetical protein
MTSVVCCCSVCSSATHTQPQHCYYCCCGYVLLLLPYALSAYRLLGKLAARLAARTVCFDDCSFVRRLRIARVCLARRSIGRYFLPANSSRSCCCSFVVQVKDVICMQGHCKAQHMITNCAGKRYHIDFDNCYIMFTRS